MSHKSNVHFFAIVTADDVNTATLINHIYTTLMSPNATCTVLPPLTSSGHNYISVSLPIPLHVTPTKVKRKVWLYHRANQDTINAALESQLPEIQEDPTQVYQH